MNSPAYRVLSIAAHRATSRIEIELAHHGGQDNGKLPVTFKDFVNYGIARSSIGPALAEAEALGFIEITERGKRARAANYRRPNLFRLTTRPELEGVGPERCRWRRFKTIEEEAQHVAYMAREGARPNLKARQCQKGTDGPFHQCQKGTTDREKGNHDPYFGEGRR